MPVIKRPKQVSEMSDEELAGYSEPGLEEGDLADYAMPVKGLATKGLRGLAREGVQLATRKGSEAVNEKIAADTGLPPPSATFGLNGIVASMAKGKPPRGPSDSSGIAIGDVEALRKTSQPPVRKGPGSVNLGKYWDKEGDLAANQGNVNAALREKVPLPEVSAAKQGGALMEQEPMWKQKAKADGTYRKPRIKLPPKE